MSVTEENRRIITQIFAALDGGDSRPYRDALAEEVRMTHAGRSPWSRQWVGKAAVLRDLYGYVFSLLVAPVRLTIKRILADGDHVAVLASGKATTKKGEAYDNEYCIVYRLQDGKIVEILEHMDTDLALRVLGPPPAEAAQSAQGSPAGMVPAQ
jgi:ketosteroid isomerase-like protein